MTQTIPVVSVSSKPEPWKEFIPRATDREIFYYVSPDFSTRGLYSQSYSLYKDKEIKNITAFTDPMAAFLCKWVYDIYIETDRVWLVEGKPENGCCSIDGRVILKNCKILKKMNLRLTMTDAFKVVGGTIMKIHFEQDFINWFIDSIGNRNEKNAGGKEISKFARRVSDKYRDVSPTKYYEYLSACNLVEYKESRDLESMRCRQLGSSFLYALHAAHTRGKEIDISDTCEKTLTLIKTGEKINLPV